MDADGEGASDADGGTDGWDGGGTQDVVESDAIVDRIDGEVGAVDASHCSNGAADGDETDVDCGGPTCNKCTKFRRCLVNTDCINFCNLTTHKCG